MISASKEQVLLLARGWSESNCRIRLITSLKALAMGVTCSVVSVQEDEIGLRISGQSHGVVAVRLSGCKFSFGAGDMPESETELPVKLDAGVSILTPDMESLWLLEVVD